MTREEADIMRDFWRLIVSERYTDEEIKKAYDKAIESKKKEGAENEARRSDKTNKELD